jgi:hypothetical protein
MDESFESFRSELSGSLGSNWELSYYQASEEEQDSSMNECRGHFWLISH